MLSGEPCQHDWRVHCEGMYTTVDEANAHEFVCPPAKLEGRGGKLALLEMALHSVILSKCTCTFSFVLCSVCC